MAKGNNAPSTQAVDVLCIGSCTSKLFFVWGAALHVYTCLCTDIQNPKLNWITPRVDGIFNMNSVGLNKDWHASAASFSCWQETIWCDQLECLVKQRPEEEELIQNWRPFWEIEVPGNRKSSRKKSMKAKNFWCWRFVQKKAGKPSWSNWRMYRATLNINRGMSLRCCFPRSLIVSVSLARYLFFHTYTR